MSYSVRSHSGSPPGSAIPGILQARTLEWVAIAFSCLAKDWEFLIPVFTGISASLDSCTGRVSSLGKGVIKLWPLSSSERVFVCAQLCLTLQPRGLQQGSKPHLHPLHWQMDSLPLHHLGRLPLKKKNKSSVCFLSKFFISLLVTS